MTGDIRREEIRDEEKEETKEEMKLDEMEWDTGGENVIKEKGNET